MFIVSYHFVLLWYFTLSLKCCIYSVVMCCYGLYYFFISRDLPLYFIVLFYFVKAICLLLFTTFLLKAICSIWYPTKQPSAHSFALVLCLLHATSAGGTPAGRLITPILQKIWRNNSSNLEEVHTWTRHHPTSPTGRQPTGEAIMTDCWQ